MSRKGVAGCRFWKKDGLEGVAHRQSAGPQCYSGILYALEQGIGITQVGYMKMLLSDLACQLMYLVATLVEQSFSSPAFFYSYNPLSHRIWFSKLAKNNIYNDHGAIRTHKSLVPKTNALTIRPRGQTL